MRARLFGRGAHAPRLGRYVLLEKIGSGGMGVVHRAHDPELDRDVAVKLLVRGIRDAKRLLDEARSLARLSHPNVVPVFDVGEIDGTVFLAMELVEGVTLDVWLRRGRSRGEVLAILGAIGRGIAAAHAVGIVHRDLKPSNVLVGTDDRARIVDFGIAASLEESTPTPDPHQTKSDVADIVEGTPKYMPFEQHTGAPADASADQYAFAVMAVEALAGRHPFAGLRARALIAEKARTPSLRPPKGLDPRLWSVLRRGMDPEASRRWPSLLALLAALDRAARPRSMLRWAAALALPIVVLVSWPDQRMAETCDGEATAPWTDAQHADARATLVQREGSAAWNRVDERLGAFATRWSSARAVACAAADAGEPEALACLDATGRRARAFVDTVGRSGVVDGADAVRGVWRATQLDDCVAPSTNDPRTNTRLAEAEALRDVGHPDDAIALLDSTLGEVEDETSAIRVRTLRGLIHLNHSQLQSARSDLETAFHLASARDDAALAYGPALYLTSLEAVDYGDAIAGAKWLRHAEAAAERAGLEHVAADLLNARAAVEVAEGRFDDAATTHEREIELREHEDDLPRLATALHESATALAQAGRHPEAAEQLRSALQAWEEVGGPYAIDAASTRSNLGIVLAEAGEYEEAIEHHRRALEIYDTVSRRPARGVAVTLGNLGIALTYAGRHDEAITSLGDAVARFEAIDPDNIDGARTRLNLGLALMNAGRSEEAHATFLAAHESFRAALGDEHPHTAAAQANVADALAALGRDDESAKLARAAIDTLETSLGPDHPHVAGTLANLGEVELRRGHRDAGIAALDRALAIHERAPSDPNVAATLATRIIVTLGEEAGPHDLRARAQRVASG